MSDNVFLSIIIPVFNGEKYLSRCLDSLGYIERTEIIIVDDGSYDGSYEVALKYSNDNKRIRVIRHKNNYGVVKSRCDGLEIAKGDFIAYVDADDWVEGFFLKTAIKEIVDNSQIDIVVGRMRIDDSAGKSNIVCDFSERRVLDTSFALNQLFAWNYYRWELCGKLFRKSLFYGWIPDTEIKVCEDLDSTWELFKRSRNTLVMPVDYYHYFFNECSVSYNFSIINSNSNRVFEKIIRESKLYLRDNIVNIVINHYRLCLINLVREAVFDGKDDEFVSSIQNKWKMLISRGHEYESGCIDSLGSEAFLEDVEKSRNMVNHIEMDILALYDRLYSDEIGIYLYGTGAVALFVGRVLQRNGRRVFNFVVSDGEMKRNKFLDNTVSYISELSRDSRVILSINKKSQNMVLEKLKRQGFRHISLLETYGIV